MREARSKTEPQTIPDLFFERVGRSGPDAALSYKEDGRWIDVTWEAYGQRVREIAGGIADWVAPGDVACILSENRPE